MKLLCTALPAHRNQSSGDAVLFSRWAKKKSTTDRIWSVVDFWRTKKSLFFQAGLLTCGSSLACAFPTPGFPKCQWRNADLVPAYSAGPTLRIHTVFPFHLVPVKNAAPGRLSFVVHLCTQSTGKCKEGSKDVRLFLYEFKNIIQMNADAPRGDY